jgi:hypothetical protein
MNPFHPKKAAQVIFIFVFGVTAAACSPQVPSLTAGEQIPHLEALQQAASSGSTQDSLALVRFSTFPCTHREGLGGPPKCLPTEEEGTPVEVLPFLGAEGSHMRRSEIGSWSGIGPAQLYAAYKNPDRPYPDEFFPEGEFGVAFLLEDETNVVVFQVAEEGILRIDYYPLASFEELLENSEVLLGPLPPSG